MKREVEAADIRAAYDMFAKLAVSFINKMDDEFKPILAGIKVGKKPGQIEGIVPFPSDLIVLLQGSVNGLIPLVRHALTGGSSEVESADLVVHITEALLDCSKEEFDRDVVERYVEVRDHSERMEVVVVAVHTPERTYLGHCPIESHAGKRRAVFEPIDLRVIAEGRLVISPENPVKH